MFLAQALIEFVDKEYLLCTLKFRTFGNMSKKFWSISIFFFQIGSLGSSEKSLFLGKKLKLVF